MTLKYESEVLFDLMKRDGDVAPSNVLPYESELKEKYLKQVEGAYPKLQDYRPEWLYYNLHGRIPSEFPVESVANVTSASFYNVVPYAYTSAILKGSTETKNLELVSVQMPVVTTTGKNLFKGETIGENTINGDEIYFREAHSKNGAYLMVDESMIGKTYTVSCYAKRKPSNNFVVIALDKNNRELEALQQSLDTEYRYITQTITIPQNTVKLLITMAIGEQTREFWVKQLQIEENTTATSYEPYKSNILTVNEDVTLRGIGEVRDTLDCLTGEVTERIGEIVLDGSENWGTGGWREQITSIGFEMKIKNDVSSSIIVKAISDKILYNSSHNFQKDGEYFDMVGAGKGETWVRIRILRSKLSTEDVEGFKKWLSQNPLTVQYQLAAESVKTVDLSCINEQGESATFRPIEGTMHVNTSSQALPPLLDMGVPVEATTQNLMSFANIEEEE